MPKGKASGCPARDEPPPPCCQAVVRGYRGHQACVCQGQCSGMRRAGRAAACRLSLTPRQMQEALTPGHLKKAKLMFFFTRYPSSTLLKTYFLDVQVKWHHPALVPGRVPVRCGTQPTLLGSHGEGDALVSPCPAGRSGGMAPTSARAALERVLRAAADPGCQIFALCNQGIGIKAHHERASPPQGGWDPDLSGERQHGHPHVTILAGAFAPLGQGWVWGQASGEWLGLRGLRGREAPSWRNVCPLALPHWQFSRCITSQLIKWFSNFREFYYIQVEKFARQALLEGVMDAGTLRVSWDSELFRALNMHYNKGNDFEVRRGSRGTEVAGRWGLPGRGGARDPVVP